MSKVSRWVVLVFLSALTLALVLIWGLNKSETPNIHSLNASGIIWWDKSQPLPSLIFRDESDQTQTIPKLFEGHWTLVFFGFTYCPDVCPTTLAQLRTLFKKMPPETSQTLKVVMVTVDPERDTPALLKNYIRFFGKDFKALRGTIEDTQKLAKAMGIPFIQVLNQAGQYNVNHGAHFGLISPDGKQRGYITSPLQIQSLASNLPKLLKQPPP